MSINYKIHLLWDNKKLLLLLKNHLQNKLRIFLEPTLTLVERQLSTGLNLLHLFNYFSFYQFLFIIYFLSFHYFYSLLDGSSHPVFTYITPSTKEYFWWRDIYHQYPCHLIFYQHFFINISVDLIETLVTKYCEKPPLKPGSHW